MFELDVTQNSLSIPLLAICYRCILLLEDLDAAFTRSVSRDSNSTGTPSSSSSSSSKSSNSESTGSSGNDGSTLSLSGLLNSLDGVAAAEGRRACITWDSCSNDGLT